MSNVSIAPDGTITIDGKVVSPGEVATLTPAITSGISTLIKDVTNRHNWSIKNVEKLLAWGAGLVATTNGFSALSLSPNIREALLGAAAFVLGAIHVSTPTTPKA